MKLNRLTLWVVLVALVLTSARLLARGGTQAVIRILFTAPQRRASTAAHGRLKTRRANPSGK